MMLAWRLERGGPWRALLWGGIAVLLVAPAVAMQFSREIAWGAEDFAAAALLLVGGGLLFELTMRATPRRALRIAVGVAIVAIVALVWAEGAVGILD